MADGPACGGAWVAALSAVAALALAGCDAFSTDHVAQVCVQSAMKAGEPFGNQREREQTEAQLRHYCRTAAEGR